MEQTIVQGIDPAVHGQRLPAHPCITHDGGSRRVQHLFGDIELTEPVLARGARKRRKLDGVCLRDVLHMT